MVADQDGDPVQRAEDGDQRDEVAKHGARVLVDVHEAQRDEERRERHRGHGHAARVGLVEDARRLPLGGQRPDGPRGEVDVRVGRRDGEDEQEGVDDAVELADAGDLGGDDKGRRGAARAGRADEARVVVGHRHAQADDAGDVEEADAQQRLAHGARHVLARVGRLAKGDADELRAEVGEGGLDDGGPDAEEAAEVALLQVLVEGARVLPVGKASSVVVGAAAERDDEADEDQGADDEGLEQRHPELGLAEEFHVDELHFASADFCMIRAYGG